MAVSRRDCFLFSTAAQKVQCATRDLLVFIHLISKDAKQSARSINRLDLGTQSPKIRGRRRRGLTPCCEASAANAAITSAPPTLPAKKRMKQEWELVCVCVCVL